MGKKSGSGSGMNIPPGLKSGSRMGKSLIRDGKKSDPGSEINMPDPQVAYYTNGYH
jgi:hypothetical protein